MFTYDIHFSFVGATDALPISNHYRAIDGDQIINTHFLFVMWLVAAESPMKMFFSRNPSPISFVTRAFSFSPFFLRFCDDIALCSNLVGRLAFLPFPTPC